MRSIKTLLMIMLALLMLIGCAPVPKEEPKDIYIFYTSDVHCGIDENMSFPKLKALIEDTKAENENVMLVDMGDFVQGGTLGSLSKGEIIIDMMNEMEYDLVTIGNHEFDFGMDRLKELLDKASFETVATNFKYTGNKENRFADIPEYVIKEFGPVKVAFLGILTPTTITASTPSRFQEDGKYVYDFCSGNDGEELFSKIQSVVDEVRKKGANYVIALAHLGSEIFNHPYDSISLISHTSGIDVVLDGHSHSEIIGDTYPNAKGEDVILSSVGTKMQNAGELIIEKDGTISTVLVADYEKEDEKIVSAIAKAQESMNDILSIEVGELPFDLTILGEDGYRKVRNRETNIADFTTDAVRFMMNTDVAILGGGGIRDSISAGVVTYGDLLSVFPFSNVLVSCRCTGQQIIDALECGSQRVEKLAVFDDRPVGEFGGFLQVSGLKYTINTDITTPVVLDENNMLVGFNGERRVSDVQILQNGEYVPIDPNGEYTISSSNYVMMEGGDGNTALMNCEYIEANGPLDLDALISWFQELNGDFSDYAEPQGRITVN